MDYDSLRDGISGRVKLNHALKPQIAQPLFQPAMHTDSSASK